MSGTALALARWAHDLQPTADDLRLADRALADTVAVTIAGRDHPVAEYSRVLSEPGRWAAVGHVLDFDDLHMESTSHISVVCVPLALAAGGGARTYLIAAGVMARIGMALGWPHYSSGWHVTCTAGALAAAAGAAGALGMGPEGIAAAMAFAVPAAGGEQRAFGTDAKSLQVGGALDAGMRAAQLAATGASCDLSAVDDWIALLRGSSPDTIEQSPAIPGGLAVKIFPCCYALQRPIATIAELKSRGVVAADVARIVVTTSESSVKPLIHDAPSTGLEGKFSLQYSVAAALLDDYCGFASFEDAAVQRAEARALVERTEVRILPGGEGLLSGDLVIELELHDRSTVTALMADPPGSPSRPPSQEALGRKIEECIRGVSTTPSDWTWENSAALLRAVLD